MTVKTRKQRRYGGKEDGGPAQDCTGRRRHCGRECGRPLPCHGKAGSAKWTPRGRRGG